MLALIQIYYYHWKTQTLKETLFLKIYFPLYSSRHLDKTIPLQPFQFIQFEWKYIVTFTISQAGATRTNGIFNESSSIITKPYTSGNNTKPPRYPSHSQIRKRNILTRSHLQIPFSSQSMAFRLHNLQHRFFVCHCRLSQWEQFSEINEAPLRITDLIKVLITNQLVAMVLLYSLSFPVSRFMIAGSPGWYDMEKEETRNRCSPRFYEDEARKRLHREKWDSPIRI